MDVVDVPVATPMDAINRVVPPVDAINHVVPAAAVDTTSHVV